MKILDRYLIKQLLIPILFCSCTLIFLVFMADIFDRLDEILKNKTSFGYLLSYYLALTPKAFVETISWASLLGTIYVLTTLNFHNEITAMKVSGLEITSIIRPVVFVGFLIGVLTFVVSDCFVPEMTRKATEIKEERIELKKTKKQRKMFENVTYFGGGNRLYYARSLDLNAKKLNDFIILWLDGQKRVRKKTIAQEAVWTKDGWELHRVSDYTIERSSEMVGEPAFNATLTYPEIKETPEEFAKAASESASISYRELKDYIAKMKANGITVDAEAVELYYKLSFPWQSLAVMFLTVPFLAKTTTRRLIAVNVLACITLVFLFHVMGAVMLALGKAGKIFPFLSAWFHNFAFGFGSFFFLDRANH